jgi:hypothetical protein
MFGPNPVPPAVETPTHDHRSARGVALRARVIELLTSVFALDDYELLLIPGPATLAMQAVIETVGGCVDVAGGGRFADRWRAMRRFPALVNPPWSVGCLLETSCSTLNSDSPATHNSLRIVDAVSGWPYYPLPPDTAIFVTTSNKLLGAAPGLAIVGVRRDVWGLLENPKSEIRNPKTERFSYLDLRRHRGDQFLTTAPMPVLAQLERTIVVDWTTGRVRRQIDEVCEVLRGAIPPDIFIGERVCPVLTLDRAQFDARFPGVAARWEFYPATRHTTDRYHLFTYSEAAHWYYKLARELRQSRGPFQVPSSKIQTPMNPTETPPNS